MNCRQFVFRTSVFACRSLTRLRFPHCSHKPSATFQRRCLFDAVDSRGSTTMDHPQDQVQRHSISDPESFWSHQADQLHWHKKPTAALARTTKSLKSGEKHAHWEWFPDGEISTCYNCVDRHVLAGHGEAPAILYDSPVTNTKQRITYKQLLDEVEVFAGVLREEGVKKGDVVLVYSTSLSSSPCHSIPDFEADVSQCQ